MESFVSQPGAEQVRPPMLVCEAGGSLPGRLPFIWSPNGTPSVPLLPDGYSSEGCVRFYNER